MELSVRDQSGHRIVTVHAHRIDAPSAVAFKTAIRQSLRGNHQPVILDLGEVDFIDSSGLGAIVAVRKLVTPEPGLALAHLSPDVTRVFTLTRLDTVFDILPPAARPG